MGNKKWGQFRQLCIWVGILVACVAVQPFLWKYVTASAYRLQGTRSADDQSDALRLRLEEIKKEASAATQLTEQIPLSFPPIAAAPQAVERLEQLAGHSGVVAEIISIDEKQPQTVKGRAEIVPLAITVQILGTPAQLLSYLDRVEHAPEAAQVISLLMENASSTRSVEDQLTYKLTMVVSFYLMREL
ncbi:MAG: hypothetical protein WD200_00065 [Candidatus Andersenbacteria bacterium]